MLGILATLLIIYFAGTLRWGARPTELLPGTEYDSRIDLNHAGRAELLQLPGVGPSLAQRIENDRSEHGLYKDLNELQRVPGIGVMTAERLRPWLRVAGDSTSGQRDGQAVHKPGSGKSKKTPPAHPIDLNIAGEMELRSLPGVGPVLAQRIIEARGKEPFRTVEDLRRVTGIGPKIFERIKPYVMVKTGSAQVVAAR
jgi:competence protein ComEA